LIISIGSWPIIQRMKARNAARETLLNTATADLAQAQSNEHFIRAALGREGVNDRAGLPLDDAYARTMVRVREKSKPLLVTIQAVTVGSRQLEAKGVVVGDVAEPVTISGRLRKIRIRLQGRYESLPDLLNYLDLLRAAPAVVKSVEIVKDQFDTELLVMGI